MTGRIKPTQSALLLGGGYVARFLAPVLRARGYRVAVTTRNGQTDIPDVDCFEFDSDANLSASLARQFTASDIIINSIPPAKSGEDSALQALSHLTPKARWIGYLSATSVYGDRDSGWAFEGEAPTPSLARGRHRADAELAWIETGWPVHIFRLAGIYGPGRSPFAKLARGDAQAIIKAGHIVNRIHVHDIVTAVMASIDAPNPLSLYNIADGHPAPPQEVLDFAARLLGMPPPERISMDHPSISKMRRSFYAETKKINISKAKGELGWTPQFTDYRAGLLATLKAEDPNPDAVYLMGRLHVPAADLAAVRAALPDHIAKTRKERGNRAFRVEADQDDPQIFHVFEIFDTPQDFAAHQTRAAQSDWARISANATRDYRILGA